MEQTEKGFEANRKRFATDLPARANRATDLARSAKKPRVAWKIDNRGWRYKKIEIAQGEI
jgi:hypothetical protein